MTKVVFQDRAYWLRGTFWRDAAKSDARPTRFKLTDGLPLARPIYRPEFGALFAGRVASWVLSERKSVSVFRAALSPDRRKILDRLFLESIRDGLEMAGQEFTARTGAQGKVRRPADVSFVVMSTRRRRTAAHNCTPTSPWATASRCARAVKPTPPTSGNCTGSARSSRP